MRHGWDRAVDGSRCRWTRLPAGRAGEPEAGRAWADARVLRDALDYYAKREAAERQYDVDVQQLGVQAADLRFRERNADATNELQRRSG